MGVNNNNGTTNPNKNTMEHNNVPSGIGKNTMFKNNRPHQQQRTTRDQNTTACRGSQQEHNKKAWDMGESLQSE